jgi:hypothetical protein
MLTLPPELIRSYDTLLGQKGIAMEHRPHYKKWLRYYWDFCHKYDLGPRQRQSLLRFDEKLRAKHQSNFQRHQARHAVSLYYDLVLSTRNAGQPLQVLVNGSKNLDATLSVPPQEKAATSAPPVRPLSDLRGPRRRENRYRLSTLNCHPTRCPRKSENWWIS